jgi:hypothetical protein
MRKPGIERNDIITNKLGGGEVEKIRISGTQRGL